MSHEPSPDLYEAFAELESAPAKERARLLHAIGERDPDARARLESLLTASESAGDFLETPAVARGELERIGQGLDPAGEDGGPDPWVGRELGAYRLTHRIGAGGTSNVYAAERSDRQFDKRVAVKILSRDTDTAALARRLRTERQVLAGLEHPHIARLLDGGEAPGGLPYIVMEFVDGVAIDEFCDERRLSVDERVRLFLDVCAAVEHAHAHGVIHRDLKPSNVLVDRSGGVKLLDFGIAKVHLAPGEHTATAAAMMTPHYASPEQLRGDGVTPATDVYSLGVLLHELLVGQLPFPLTEGGIASWIERVCHQEPSPPSDVVHLSNQRQLAARATDGGRLSRSVRGDLDTIVLKALEKEPDRRYESPRALGEDLERFLEGHPVHARGRSFFYRARKWLSRNRVPAASAAVALVALVGAVTLTSSQFLGIASLIVLAATAVVTAGLYARAESLRRQAQRYRDRSDVNRRKSEEVSRFLKSMLRSVTPDVARGKDIELLRTVLEDTAGRIGREFVDQPDVAADIHVTVAAVYSSLVSFDRARAHLDRAGELISAESHPDIYGDLLLTRAQLAMQEGQYEDAIRILEEAEPLLSGSNSDRRATFLMRRALALEMSGRIEEAAGAHREALDFARAELDPTDTAIAEAWQHLGVFERQHGSMEEAEAALREAVRLHDASLEREGASHHGTDALEARHSLARLLVQVRQFEEAEALYRDLLRQADVVLGSRDPGYVRYMVGFASLKEAQAHWDEAESLHRRALEIQRETLGDGHVDVATTYNNLGYHYQRTRRFEESHRAYTDARRAYVHALGEEHPWVALVDLNHALTLLAMGDPDAAGDALDRLSRRDLDDPGQMASRAARFLRGVHLIDTGNPEGETMVRELIADFEEHVGVDHPMVTMGRDRLSAIEAQASSAKKGTA